jgi:two-component system LytT family sensor kinase
VTPLIDDDGMLGDLAAARAAERGWPRLVRRFGLFLGGLTLLSLFTAVHTYAMYLERAPIGWAEAILSGFAVWYPWLILGPAVFWLVRHLPFEPGRWGWAVLAHLLAAPVFSALHSAMRTGLSPWVDPKPIPFTKVFLAHLLLTYLSYLAMVAVYQAWMNYRRFRDRELRASQLESRLAQAHLEVLRMQLHPHVLFNTLHAISTLIHRDPEAADEMVTQLSDLLRMTLDNIGVQEVSLKEELDFLQRYLEIQQTRFQDRLSVTLDIPPETLDARVPNQALQPIVENAIRHGLDGRQGGGLIEIRARAVSAMLQLTVRDDGPGIRINGTTPPPDGIGLANTRARLKQLYGPLASLDLANASRGGTLVTMLIPQSQPVAAATAGDAP